MMNRLTGFAALALVVLTAVVAGGCVPVRSVLGNTGSTLDLDGTRWDLVALNGRAPDGSGEGTLDFALDAATGEGRVSGTAFCNRFSGSYVQDGAELTFGPLMSTRMACPEGTGPEGDYVAALEAVASARLDGVNLVLSNASGDDVLVLAPGEQAGLEGTLWHLSGYRTNAGGIRTLVPDTEISATFGGGAIQGTGGCNSYSGPYTPDGASLTIGPVARTEMGCMTPDGVMDQEQVYFKDLEEAAGYAIDRNTLTLLDAGGTALLTFVAAE